MDRWSILSKKTVLERRIFSVADMDCVLPSKKGIGHTFTVIESPDWINIVARTRDGKLIFVRQHRLGTDEVTLETTAGIIEKGEDPAIAATRELAEETGYTSDSLQLLRTLDSNPAIMTNRTHFFFADNCIQSQNQELDREESIAVELYSIEDTMEMIRSGKINHSIIVTALSLFFFSRHYHGSAPTLI